MEMLQIAGFAVAAAFSAAVIRRLKPDLGMALALAAGAMLLLALLGRAGNIVAALRELCDQAGLQSTYVQTLFKVVGICFLADLAASVCRDAEEEGLAQRVETAGRVLVMAIAVPVLTSLLKQILELVP